MKELTKDLAEQAFTFAYLTCKKVGRQVGENDNVFIGLAMGKLYEMVVAQAIDVVQKRYMGDNNREDMEVLRCVEALRKHFVDPLQQQSS